MLTLQDLQKMSPKLRGSIDKANFDEACGIQTNHSYSAIIRQKREPAIAARMVSRPVTLMKYSYDAAGNLISHGATSYNATQIVNIIVESVRQNTTPLPYPLTGDWTNYPVNQLYLFIRGKACARFTVKEVSKSNGISTAELQKFTDPSPIIASTYKSVAYITDVVTDNLPDDFLGNFSGISVKDSAFKGCKPLVHIL
ncbi:MAG: hypothetical protein K2K89_03605 [Ruminococcus sp.]|nr:hypothetical protein [Ruminococcus sp.]